MKIIGGQFKGRNFFTVKDIRPTQSFLRKSLFDILGQTLEGELFLDVFAGSGGIGFEAVSRGAGKVTFLEKDGAAQKVIVENANLLNINDYRLLAMDAFAGLKQLAVEKSKFDIIFIDPPYGRDQAKKALNLLGACDIFNANCMIIIQHEKREILPDALGRIVLFRRKISGTTQLSFYRIE